MQIALNVQEKTRIADIPLALPHAVSAKPSCPPREKGPGPRRGAPSCWDSVALKRRSTRGTEMALRALPRIATDPHTVGRPHCYHYETMKIRCSLPLRHALPLADLLAASGDLGIETDALRRSAASRSVTPGHVRCDFRNMCSHRSAKDTYNRLQYSCAVLPRCLVGDARCATFEFGRDIQTRASNDPTFLRSKNSFLTLNFAVGWGGGGWTWP